MTNENTTAENAATAGGSRLERLVSCPLDGKQPTYRYHSGMHWYGRGGTGWMVEVWGMTKEAAAERWNALFVSEKAIAARKAKVLNYDYTDVTGYAEKNGLATKFPV